MTRINAFCIIASHDGQRQWMETRNFGCRLQAWLWIGFMRVIWSWPYTNHAWIDR